MDEKSQKPNRKTQIEKLVQEHLRPVHFEVIDESHMHSRGRETHFKVVIVSEKFSGLSRVKRQQLVFACLNPVMEAGLHALSQATMTPDEWKAGVSVNASPVCASKSSTQKC